MIQDRRTGLWIPESCQKPDPKFPPVLNIPQDARPGKMNPDRDDRWWYWQAMAEKPDARRIAN